MEDDRRDRLQVAEHRDNLWAHWNTLGRRFESRRINLAPELAS